MRVVVGLLALLLVATLAITHSAAEKSFDRIDNSVADEENEFAPKDIKLDHRPENFNSKHKSETGNNAQDEDAEEVDDDEDESFDIDRESNEETANAEDEDEYQQNDGNVESSANADNQEEDELSEEEDEDLKRNDANDSEDDADSEPTSKDAKETEEDEWESATDAKEFEDEYLERKARAKKSSELNSPGCPLCRRRRSSSSAAAARRRSGGCVWCRRRRSSSSRGWVRSGGWGSRRRRRRRRRTPSFRGWGRRRRRRRRRRTPSFRGWGRRRRRTKAAHGSSGSSGSNGIKKTCLEAHNAYRAKHKDTPPMTYDSTLAQEAQAYAKQLVGIGSLVHASSSARKGAGENLAWSSGDLSYGGAVKMWYDEIKNYDFNTGKSKGGVIGHFTQLVWDKSTKLGCGLAKGTGGTYVVARYRVHGNMEGTYTTHVKRLK